MSDTEHTARGTLQRVSDAVALVLWVGVIFGFSLTANPGAGVDPGFVRLVGPFMHAGVFLILGVLLASSPGRRWSLLWLVGCGLLVALADEFLIQALMSQRVSDVWDIVADAAGLVAGLWIAPHVRRLVPPVQVFVVAIFLLTVLRFLLA